MRYKTGRKKDVLRYMAQCAIRDRKGFIEAIAHCDHMESERSETLNEIADFMALAGLCRKSDEQREH